MALLAHFARSDGQGVPQLLIDSVHHAAGRSAVIGPGARLEVRVSADGERSTAPTEGVVGRSRRVSVRPRFAGRTIPIGSLYAETPRPLGLVSAP